MMMVVVKSSQNGNEFATNGPLCFDHNKHKRPPQPQRIQGGTLCVCVCVYIECLSDDRSKEKLSWKWYQKFRKKPHNKLWYDDKRSTIRYYGNTKKSEFRQQKYDEKNSFLTFRHTHTHTQRDINTYYLYKSRPV